MFRYLETFFRTKWLVIIPAIILTWAGAGFSLLDKREYRAGATLWTETLAYLDVPTLANRYRSAADVQAARFQELIQTNTFATAIVEKTPVGATGSEVDKIELADKVQDGMSIRASGEHSIRVNFAHTDPDVALAVVTVAIEEYDRVMIESANMQATQAIDFYKERLREYETTILPRSSRAVTEYLESHPSARDGERDGGAPDPNFVLIQQQAELERAQYENYRERLDEVLVETDAASRSQALAFRIMDPPGLANASDNGLNLRTMVLYVAMGTGVGAGYVTLFLLIATELDRTMRSSSDVRRRLHLPVLEIIPDYTVRGRRARRQRQSEKVARAARPLQSSSRG